MHRYHPTAHWRRAMYSRAIWSENGRHPCASCYLDVTHLGAAFVKRRFPTIYATCLVVDDTI